MLQIDNDCECHARIIRPLQYWAGNNRGPGIEILVHAIASFGGHAALRIAIDKLLDTWEALASDKSANAERLYYGYPRDKALLHDPLDPLLATLNPDYRRFTAGRSMRDVEHAAILKITDPYGQPLG